MNLRKEWSTSTSDDNYFTKDETLNDVKENFNIRRYYSNEGATVFINGIEEQVIIQDHSNPINQDKEDKQMLIPMESLAECGDYVIYRNETWLIISRINIVDDGYKTCQIYRCNWILKFQNEIGDILSYPCIDSTTYSTIGTTESKIIDTGNALHLIKIPCDEDTLNIRLGKRFFVDKHKTKPIPYEVTNCNTTKYNYGNKGVIELMLKQDVSKKSPNDRVDLGICDYIDPKNPNSTSPSAINCKITSSRSNFNDKVKLGITYIFTSMFTDDNNNTLTNIIPNYSIKSSFYDVISMVIDSDDSVSITLDEKKGESHIGETFELVCEDSTIGYSDKLELTVIGKY